MKMSRMEKRTAWIAASFIAPNFMGFLFITLGPVLFSVALSFLNWNGGAISGISWAGLNNYRQLFSNFSFDRSNMGIALKNTVAYTLVTVPLTMLCSLLLALVLNRAVKGARFFRGALFFPYVASLVAVCTCWNFILMKYGPVNRALSLIGVDIGKTWTQTRDLSLWTIVILSVWRNAGYYMVMYLAGLQGVPRELYEAATVDGATGLQRFRHITLPMLTPTTFFVSIMMTIYCFKIYDVVEIMTEGGPGRATKMLVTYIYELSFDEIRYGAASAVAMVLFLLVLLVTLIQFRAERKWVNYM